MPPEAAITDSEPATGAGAPAAASRLIRRTHMYLALFLTPWMLVYALSTVVMNHREFVTSLSATKQPAFVTERELDYTRSFPRDATPQQMGRQILADLDLDGAHRVSGGKDGKPLVIDRLQALALRRITFRPDSGKIRVEREEFRGSTFLERMHRRRGYQQDYVRDDTWAVTVDLAIAAMLFWSLSGIWLWWELRPTRRWGAVCAGLGWISFALFLAWL